MDAEIIDLIISNGWVADFVVYLAPHRWRDDLFPLPARYLYPGFYKKLPLICHKNPPW
jgi:hypothetical protein